MRVLDDPASVRRHDTKDVLLSIDRFPDQCEQAWKKASAVSFPSSYRRCTRVVVHGMGGSGLGTHVIQGVFGSALRVPLELIQTYDFPPSVGPETVYMLSSYSGATAEGLSTIPAAKRNRAKITGLTTGGALAAYFTRRRVPFYHIDDDANPSGQPRLGLGYSIIGQLALLKRLGALAVPEADVLGAVTLLRRLVRRYGAAARARSNPAKQLAAALHGRIPIFVAASHLAGCAHVLANQLNETAKTFSAFFLLSEANHHLLEGLAFPRSNRASLAFVFLDSPRYDPRLRKRLRITREVVRRQGIPVMTHTPNGKSALEESLAAVLFGSYVSFYESVLNRVDPGSVPWVAFLKKQLAGH